MPPAHSSFCPPTHRVAMPPPAHLITGSVEKLPARMVVECDMCAIGLRRASLIRIARHCGCQRRAHKEGCFRIGRLLAGMRLKPEKAPMRHALPSPTRFLPHLPSSRRRRIEQFPQQGMRTGFTRFVGGSASPCSRRRLKPQDTVPKTALCGGIDSP